MIRSNVGQVHWLLGVNESPIASGFADALRAYFVFILYIMNASYVYINFRFKNTKNFYSLHGTVLSRS